MMLAGLTGGPFVSSFLPRSAAMLTAALLNVAAAMYILFVLPESHHAADDSSHAEAGGTGEKRALLQGTQKSYSGSGSGSAAPQKKKDAPRGMMMAWTFLKQNRITALIGIVTLVSQLASFGVGQIYYRQTTAQSCEGISALPRGSKQQ